MTMPYTTAVWLHNMPFRASKEKISTLLRQKTEEAIKAMDSIQNVAKRCVADHSLHNNLARPILRRGKAFLVKATEIGKIGFVGIFAGVFCILFALIYAMIYYANRRE